MLRGIYSQLSHFSKFILLITLVFSLLLFSSLLGILILVPFYGSGVAGLLTNPDFRDPSIITAMKVLQILNMGGGLLLPAAIYLWLIAPGGEKQFGFNKPDFGLSVLLSVVLIVLAQPLIGWATEINSYLSLPESMNPIEDWMKNAEDQGAKITEAFLATTSTGGLLLNIFMIAILPAFAEELLFRGAVAGLLKNWSKNTHLAVMVSAFIFAAIHLQFYGFLPRFLLGVALGYLYFWSGSLWLPIAAHFANNFLSVSVEFLYRKGLIQTNAENFGTDNAIWLTTTSIAMVCGILYYIYKLSYTPKITEQGNEPDISPR
jgi:hypothetical protein